MYHVRADMNDPDVERLARSSGSNLVIAGVLQNPVAAPGHPLCHLVRIDDRTLAEIEREIETGEFSERPWA